MPGKLVAGEAVTSTISGQFTVTRQESSQLKREADTVHEFWCVETIEIELGDATITVGKRNTILPRTFRRNRSRARLSSR